MTFRDFDDIFKHIGGFGLYQLVIRSGAQPNSSWPSTPCQYGWTYNYSIFYPTITSELNWVCDDNWKPVFAQSLFFVGAVVGSVGFGWMADYFGRLPAIVVTNVMGGVAGIASAFSNSLTTFIALRFIVGLTYDSNVIIIFILVLEYVSTEYRTMAANIPIMIFLTATMCAMPWIAYGLADWKTFTIVIHASQLLSFAYIWLVPESARWLMTQGKVDQTLSIITKAAKMNGRELEPGVLEEFKEYAKSQKISEDQKVTWLDLVKTPVLRKRFFALCAMWCGIIIAYDSHMRNTENLGTADINVFYTFTIAGAIELPADLITIIFVEKIGRRHTTVWTLVLAGVASIAVAAFNKNDFLAILLVAMIGRFLITMSINVGTQYIVEVLPTVARGQGSGAIHTLGHLAGFSSPYIVYLSNYGHWLPYFVIGIITIVCGLISLILPETLDQKLPDSLEDGENFLVGESCCYNPCRSRRREDKEDNKDHITIVKNTSCNGTSSV
ncbi:organic cation transporter protein-like isoform X2 [Oratosquilla oratoria]|uniref:organic cation transporter protein-like isoform X2 n=1 Tax=Oratosquilla oratoria TaxID=337810 RepID=UPI003F773817